MVPSCTCGYWFLIILFFKKSFHTFDELMLRLSLFFSWFVALFKGNVGGVHLKVKFGLGGDTLGTLCISLGFLLFPNIKSFIVKLIKNLLWSPQNHYETKPYGSKVFDFPGHLTNLIYQFNRGIFKHLVTISQVFWDFKNFRIWILLYTSKLMIPIFIMHQHVLIPNQLIGKCHVFSNNIITFGYES